MPHTYGAGQGFDALHVRMMQKPDELHVRPPPHSALVLQDSRQAPKFSHVVVPGHCELLEQPLHTPPGAVTAQVRPLPRQSEFIAH